MKVFLVIENNFGTVFIGKIFANKEAALSEQARLTTLNTKEWVSYRIEERELSK